MSCGLGAMVLVFMLIKHNVDKTLLEAELLNADIERLEKKSGELKQSISESQASSEEVKKSIEKTSAEIAVVQNKINEVQNVISIYKNQIEGLKESIQQSYVAKKSDVIERPKVGEETYWMGLKVEGPKIAILLDQSASMTDEILIDIIRRKNSTPADKKAGPKWKRTIQIVKWILARLPEKSDVMIVAFNDKAKYIGGNLWKQGRDPNALSAIFKELDELVPEGPTNLQAGLTAIASTRPTNIYVITDGLPTTGDSGYKSLNPFSTCPSLIGSSSTISGECRIKLFYHTVTIAGLQPSIKINAILLPIEGDPNASMAFWQWASRTGGLLFTPAADWP
jgi:hypothetical protein